MTGSILTWKLGESSFHPFPSYSMYYHFNLLLYLVINGNFYLYIYNPLYINQATSLKDQLLYYRVRICKRLRSPGIDSKKLIPPAYVAWLAGTITNLFYRPDRLHKLAESIPGLLKHLQIRVLSVFTEQRVYAAKKICTLYIKHLLMSFSLYSLKKINTVFLLLPYINFAEDTLVSYSGVQFVLIFFLKTGGMSTSLVFA